MNLILTLHVILLPIAITVITVAIIGFKSFKKPKKNPWQKLNSLSDQELALIYKAFDEAFFKYNTKPKLFIANGYLTLSHKHNPFLTIEWINKKPIIKKRTPDVFKYQTHEFLDLLNIKH